MTFAGRIARIGPSIPLELAARAKALVAAGHDVVNMAVGEPDFPAPLAVRRAAAEKAESGDVRYTPAAGTPALRAAIATHLTSTRGTPYTVEEVAVCHSGKHALSGTLWTLVEAGDEVLVPLPAWASYTDIVRVTGAEAVLVAPLAGSLGARPDLDALRRAATPRTRAVILNSPNNPSGYVWTRAEVEALAVLAREHDLWIISDEIYRSLVYDGPPAVSPVELGDETRARTAVIDGASKRFAMTGYRIGFVAGPAELISAVAKLHSQTAGPPNAVGQAAYERALLEEPPELETMRRAYAERRRVLLDGLAELGLPTAEPRGAFYAFPDISAHTDERGSVGFSEDLLADQRLVVVPGSAFGVEGHVRLCYALDVEAIREALRRLGAFVRSRGTVPTDPG